MRNLFFILLLVLFLTLPVFKTSAVTISNIEITPDLDISLFSSYTITADVSDYDTSSPVTLDLKAVNGDGDDCWRYYADGTCNSSALSFDMTYDSGTTWKKTTIRPDHIYPQIIFAPSSITWNYAPSNLDIRRNSYHILHLNNPFTMLDDMSFWIEINATPVSTVNSADLLVYLVKKGQSVTFFNSDWRNSTSVELVGSINRATDFNHQHTANSEHFLVALATNADGTIGSKSLDVSDDFWIILYANSPNTNRGWYQKYHGQSLCTNSDGWFLGNQIGWTTSAQAGCPDVHIHLARRTGKVDGLIATTTAGSVSSAETFSFGVLPNLSPNQSSFLTPTIGGTYSGDINIDWATSTDPNIGDSITYDLYLLDSNSNDILPALAASTSNTYYSLDSTSLDDGNYSLRGLVHDGVNTGVAFDLGGNFTVDNNSNPIQTLTSISIASNNTDNTLADTGNTVVLSFEASGAIDTPTVSIYSGGMEVSNSITITNTSGNNWTATYKVSSADTEGSITFNINSANLDQDYFNTTDNSNVIVDLVESISVVTNTSGSNESRRMRNLLANNTSTLNLDYIKQLIDSLQKKIGSLAKTENSNQETKISGFIFMNDLKTGIKNSDVKELQKYLNANGFVLTQTGPGSPGNETDFFGSLTKKVLIEFQKKNNIKPAIGYFGPITRKFINSRQ